LWATDGTSAGTSLIKDIYPGPTPSHPHAFTVWKDKLYFSAYEPTTGRELWVSDGTPAGTSIVADIHIGSLGSSPNTITPAGNRLFLLAYTEQYGFELYVIGPVGTPGPGPGPGSDPDPTYKLRATTVSSGCSIGSQPIQVLVCGLMGIAVYACRCRRRSRSDVSG
jgi:ELWxxDGT repeat protein